MNEKKSTRKPSVKKATTPVKTATVKKEAAKKTVVKKEAAPKATSKKAPAKKVATTKTVTKAVKTVKAVKATPAKKKEALSEAVSLAAVSLFQLRAENVQLIDLRGINDVADYFLIATCTSEAQMQAILNELTKEFKSKKIQTKGIEYKSGVQWAVFDAGFELMVHLFEETKREEIQMDRLYSDANIQNLQEKDFIKKTTKNKAITEDDLI